MLPSVCGRSLKLIQVMIDISVYEVKAFKPSSPYNSKFSDNDSEHGKFPNNFSFLILALMITNSADPDEMTPLVPSRLGFLCFLVCPIYMILGRNE